LNADNERLKKIEKNAATNYLKTRSKFSEWIFVNRILNNLNDDGVGVIVLRDAAMSTGMAKDIRKDLIENNLVKAVIQLPSNLITNTAISTTLLVLQKHSEDNVVFVNASETYTKKGRLQKAFETKDIKSIMNGLSSDTEISKKVSKEVIKNNDYNLSPVRYLVNIEDRLLNPVKLTDIVEAIRGKDVSKKKLDDEQNKDKAGYLLNLSDLKDFKINIPKQKISQEILDEYDKYLLKPMDIVISTRSSELKIAIVNENLASNNIIISSNFNILRVKDNKINPYYLFAFLTSQIGTEQFEQLMTGTVINVISQKALQEYKVSLLGQESQEDIAFKMEEELVEYYSYLNKIQRFQNKLPQLFHENGGE
ncbi:N-6 DNA methylase, partial [Staphylococcus pseudintermedius]|nr:N-6 DNA methylase [Staphylococcus pseudintermedius]